MSGLILEPLRTEPSIVLVRYPMNCRDVSRLCTVVLCPDPFQKIEKGSGNMATQCLVPKEFNQPHNHMLIFIHLPGQNGRWVQLHGLHDWTNVSLCQWGTSLAYEWRLLPRYISKQRFTSLLGKDHEAGESDSYVCFAVLSITRYVRPERSGFMCKTCFLPFKPYLQLTETLLSNIYVYPWQKCYWAGRKTDKCISPRSESFLYLLLLHQQQLFRPHSFSQQHQTWSELSQTCA